MKKKLFLAASLILSLSISACSLPFAKDPTPSVSVSDDTSSDTATPSSIKLPDKSDSSVGTTADSNTRDLTSVEVDFFTKLIMEDYGYGFVQTYYSDVRDANLDTVLYDLGSDEVTDKEYERVLELMGEDQLYIPVFKVTKNEIDSFLIRNTGYELEDFHNYLNGAVYDPESDCYYRCKGDTNFVPYMVEDGVAINDSIFVLHVVYDKYFYDQVEDDGFAVTRTEVAMEKVNGEYHFLSCRQMIDENMIPDRCYEIVSPIFGRCQFYSYMPTSSDKDVSFKIVKNGVVQMELGKWDKKNFTDSPFVSIEDIGFKDYSGDGYPDVIAVCKYADGSYKYQCYGSRYAGYLYYDEDMTTILSEQGMKCDYDSAYQFAFEHSAGAGENWLGAYIDYINNSGVSENHPTFSFMILDDNDIPELVCVGDCEASGNVIATYYDGNVNELVLNRLYFSYQYGSGLLLSSEGHMGYYWDIVYELKDGKFTCLGEGEYEEDYNNPIGDGEYPMIYKWNGKEVSEEKYKESLNDIYYTGYGLDGYDWDDLFMATDLEDMYNGVATPLF